MNLKRFSKRIFLFFLVMLMLFSSTYTSTTIKAEKNHGNVAQTSSEDSIDNDDANSKNNANISIVDSVYSTDAGVQEEVNSEENIVPNDQVTTTVYESSVTDAVYFNLQDNYSDLMENKTNRFIIKYKNEGGSTRLNNALKSNIAKVRKLKNKKNSNFEVITTKKKMKKEDLLTEIKNKKVDSDIEYIQPDYEMTASSYDPYFNSQWGIYNSGELEKEIDTISSTDISQQGQSNDSANTNENSISWEKAAGLGLPFGFDNDPLYMNALNDLKQKLAENENNSINTQTGTKNYNADAKVQAAWEQSQGNGVIVAVLDSGIDTTQEDLAGSIWANQAEISGDGVDNDNNGFIDDVNGWDFCDNLNQVHNQETVNDEWHGTHLAGIIAAQKDNNIGISGVAPDAKIMSLKVFKNGIAYTSDIIEAIEYAEKMGAKIANCSWGTTSYNQALKDAIDNSNMTFICAAGNSHMNIDTTPVYPASFDSSNIITVTSINRYGILSSFSNYGENSVDLAAPGEDIFSTLPENEYNSSGGTSISAAFVSGEAALILSKYGDMESSSLKGIILSSSDKLSSLVGKVISGNKINCTNALLNISSNEVIQVYGNESNNDNSSNNQTSEGYSLFGSGSWTTKASLPAPRSAIQAVTLNGKIYVSGGYPTTNMVYQYDPSTNVWSQIASIANSRTDHAMSVANGKIYVFGGSNNGSLINSVEEYDPSTNIWTAKANMPTARGYTCSAVVNNIIYVIGGYGGSYLSTVEAYNPSTNTWTTKRNMITARVGAGAAAIDGQIYVAGGSDLNSVERYDPASNIWYSRASMSTVRGYVGVATSGGRLYAIGGNNGSSYLNSIEEYVPSSNTWSSCPNMPTARNSFGTTAVNNTIYAIAGYNGTTRISSVEAYTPDVFPSSISIQVGAEISGSISMFGSGDYYSFIPTTSGTYNIYTMGSTDTYGELYDSSGSLLTYNDNSYGNSNFNLNYSLTANQTYYVKVRGSNNSIWGSYKLRADILAPTTLSATATANSITLSWTPASGAVGYIVEADGTAVDVGTNTTYTHSSLTQGSSHCYRVRVKNSGGTSSALSKITINDDYGDSISTAATMQVETEKTGFINYAGDVDFFSFVPTSTAAYDIFTTTGSTDTYGYLYDSSGAQLTYNDDYDGSTNFHIIMSLQAGQKYYVKVRHHSSTGTGAYGLRVDKIVSTPANISATAMNNAISVTWSAVSGVTGYDIEVDGVIYSNSTNLSYQHNGVIPDVAHVYRVRAKNSINTSAWSIKVFALAQGSSWQFRTKMTTRRENFGAVELNGSIYAVGGFGSGFLNTLEKYDVITNTWTIMASMTTYRVALGAGSANGKIYAIGGFNGSSSVSSIEEYDPVTNTWTLKANMPTSRYYLGVTVVNGKIYAIGGCNNNGILSTVEEYNPVTNTWTTKASMPTVRYGMGVTTVNGRIYAIGGYNNNGILSTVEEYDPVTNTWTTKTNMPTARYRFGATAINGKIYAIGGAGNSGYYLNTVEVFDPIANSWTSLTGQPIGSSDLCAVTLNGKFFVLGGYNSTAGYLDTVLQLGIAQVKSYQVNTAQGNNVNLVLSGSNLYDLTQPVFTIQYDQTQLELVDLCSLTPQLDTSIGAIPGTNITILSVGPGIVTFIVTKSVTSGYSWSGVIDVIKFKSINGQPSTINLTVNK